MAIFTHGRCKVYVEGQVVFVENLTVTKTEMTSDIRPVGQLGPDEIVPVGFSVSGTLGRAKRAGSSLNSVGEGLGPSAAGTKEETVRAAAAFQGKNLDIYDIPSDKMIARIVGFQRSSRGMSFSPMARAEDPVSFVAKDYLEEDEI